MMKWYPELKLSPDGNRKTLEFLKKTFNRDRSFTYAEFGIHKADTARIVAEAFPNATMHLFDYHDVIDDARNKLGIFGDRIHYYANTTRFHDSYNWSLVKLIAEHKANVFDYSYVDGAHTFSIDALAFFLCDVLTKKDGYIDFDDYDWTLKGSSLDPRKVPIISEMYTDEQINAKQMKLIVDLLVMGSNRYVERVKNKIYQKIA
jgi:hypothetical protein